MMRSSFVEFFMALAGKYPVPTPISRCFLPTLALKNGSKTEVVGQHHAKRLLMFNTQKSYRGREKGVYQLAAA